MSLLYPNSCWFCGKLISENSPICRPCLNSIPRITDNKCNRCGREIEYCRCKIGDFAFERNISLYRYESAAAVMIKRFKYRKHPQIGIHIAQMLYNLIAVEYKNIQFDYITYVPMLFVAEFRRGYNQTEIMASIISKYLNVPCKSLLLRKLGAHSQKSRRGKDRYKNIRNKFYTNYDLKDKTILVIDDIMTTGATLSECAYTLKQAGADKVYTATFTISCKK